MTAGPEPPRDTLGVAEVRTLAVVGAWMGLDNDGILGVDRSSIDVSELLQTSRSTDSDDDSRMVLGDGDDERLTSKSKGRLSQLDVMNLQMQRAKSTRGARATGIGSGAAFVPSLLNRNNQGGGGAEVAAAATGPDSTGGRGEGASGRGAGRGGGRGRGRGSTQSADKRKV